MNIHQLSVDYVEEQDRILMRINTSQGEELRFWLTRRIALKLWPALSQVVADHVLRHGPLTQSGALPVAGLDQAARHEVAEFSKAEALQQSDFKTPFKSAAQTLPLGEQPLLLTEIRLSSQEGGQLQLQLAEQLAHGAPPRSCQMNLSTHLVHGLMHLLEKSLRRSEWLGAQDAASSSEASASDAPLRPKYLN